MTKQNNSTILNDLKSYLDLGWYIHPLKPRDKEPLTPHGFKDSSNDINQVKSWLNRWPNANWGLDCEKTQLVVFDLDNKNGVDGVENWREFCSGLGISHNNTVVAITPTGGQHIYYKAPEGFRPSNSAMNLPKGIDVRSKGYVVLPESIHPNGKPYTWELSSHPEDTEISPLPPVLIQLLSQKPRRDNPNTGQDQKRIPEGQRDNWLVSKAGKLRAMGLDEETIFTTLKSLNSKYCYPPKDDNDLRRIAKSMLNYPPEINYLDTKPTPQAHKPATFDLTDLGNAKRLVHHFGKDLRFNHKSDHWLIWSGKRWQTDETEEIRKYAHNVTLDIAKQGTEELDQSKGSELIKASLRYQSTGHITGMLTEAKSLLPILPTQLDRNSYQLNCLTGTIDLKTGKLHPHKRADLLSKITNIKYDPNAKCDVWLQFLEDIMERNANLIEFLQRAIGYTLTGDASEQCLFILHGTGANGKTTLLNTVMGLLGVGEYAKQTPTETLMIKRDGSIPNDIARLCGVRMTVASETDQGRRFSESIIKQLTGGDTIVARFLNQEFFEFQPEFKIWIATNHKPVIRGTDDAIWRRIHLIPFNYQIPDFLQDKTLSDKLKAELPGILNWAIEGCLKWQEIGLEPPDEVSVATRSYRDEMDTLGGFLEEYCEIGADFSAPVSELYKYYNNWCKENGEQPITSKAFSGILMDRGFERYRETTGRKRTMYKGIGISHSVDSYFQEGQKTAMKPGFGHDGTI